MKGHRIVASAITSFLIVIRRLVDKIRVWLGWPHLVAPTTIGAGDHDCALASLYWAAPGIPENRIVEAFGFCTENWPYGGVTNKEFQIALKYLKAETHYSTDLETLGALLDRPAGEVRCTPTGSLHRHRQRGDRRTGRPSQMVIEHDAIWSLDFPFTTVLIG